MLKIAVSPKPRTDDFFFPLRVGIDHDGHTSHQNGTSPSIAHKIFIENNESRMCDDGMPPEVLTHLKVGTTFMNGICSPSQLEAIGPNMSTDGGKRFVLLNDLDFGGTLANSIGDPYPGASTNQFTGFFYGRGHTLSNFGQISVNDADQVGLFREVLGGHIENLKIVGMNLTCDDTGAADDCNQVGILAGSVNGDTTISNIIITDSFIEGEDKVGGPLDLWFQILFQERWNSSTSMTLKSKVNQKLEELSVESPDQVASATVLQKSSFQGVVEADGTAGMGGGIVGNFASSSGTFTIKEVYANKAEIEGTKILGGIAGKMSGSTVLEDSYARPFVYSRDGSSDPRIGGIVGEALSTLTRNFSTLGNLKSGNPAGFIKVGGIAGFNNGSTCANADTNVSTMFDNQTTADINGGTDNGLGCGRFPATADFNNIKTREF